MYNAFILSYISYSLEIWGSTYPTYLNCILTAQKMIVRTMLFKSHMEHSAPLFIQLNILDIYKLHKLLIGSFIYSLVHLNSPHILSDYFSDKKHEYDTRLCHRQNLYPYHARTNSGQFAISFVGAKIWNDIPIQIRSKNSQHIFRKSLKQYLVEQYRWLNCKLTDVLTFRLLY